MRRRWPVAGLCLLFAVAAAAHVPKKPPSKLPNTSGIDGQLTATLAVDHFFSLWLVFNNDEIQTADEPFTIFAPQNSAIEHTESVLQHPERAKQLLKNHVVLGSKIDLTTLTSNISVVSLGGQTIHLKKLPSGMLQANSANIVQPKVQVPNGILIVLDNYLNDDYDFDMKNNPVDSPFVNISSLPLILKESSKNQVNSTFVENVLEVLSFLKSGVRVFQHFLATSNVSKYLKPGEEYTVFVPTDHAFQRWHPIDWGFYPFSVPEFTEDIIINHFIKGRLKQDQIRNGQTFRTLKDREITFQKSHLLSVNGAQVVKGDTPVAKGNIMFINDVLFVTESVVSKLHQAHKDKETPPLLAFPWFGAQFLSHAFLALERDRRFLHITRFLNLADLAPHVSGTGYTFFVPTDKAFEELGLDKMPDNYLSTGDGLTILLNHFIKGRLYNRDLKDGYRFTTLGNKTVSISNANDVVKVNNATIVESEVFVYNLGTMFYIDRVLFVAPKNTSVPSTTEKATTEMTTTVFDEETVPAELMKEYESHPDVLVSDESQKNGTFM